MTLINTIHEARRKTKSVTPNSRVKWSRSEAALVVVEAMALGQAWAALERP